MEREVEYIGYRKMKILVYRVFGNRSKDIVFVIVVSECCFWVIRRIDRCVVIGREVKYMKGLKVSEESLV